MSSIIAQTRPTKISAIEPHLDKGTAGPLARWVLPSALIIGGVLVAVLISAVFGVFGTPASGLVGDAVTAKALADSHGYRVVSTVETTKIVPADSLRKDLSWSPLTGDGSN